MACLEVVHNYYGGISKGRGSGRLIIMNSLIGSGMLYFRLAFFSVHFVKFFFLFYPRVKKTFHFLAFV